MKNNTNIIVLNNRLFDIGRERFTMISLLNKVQSIFPSKSLVKDDAFTQRPEPPKPMKKIENNEAKSFKEILGDEIFISAEGRDSFKVNKEYKESKENKEVNEMSKMGKMDEKECNHDPNDVNNTLKMLPKRTMEYPPKFVFVCQCPDCKQSFTYTKDSETKKYLKYDEFV